ncbi:hypothetical protein JHK87_005179 [Glycine soja]|nr:hypothetical protein JHK87_005179 [Glycine soja]
MMALSPSRQIQLKDIHPGFHSWAVTAQTIRMWTIVDNDQPNQVSILHLILFDSQVMYNINTILDFLSITITN